MRIVALLAVHNEELYMERCLDHLFRQGIETCIIDNGSTDHTRQIAERFFGRGVFRIEETVYPRYFDWVAQLQQKELLAHEIDADWFIHHDADEIRDAPSPFASLREGIQAADTAGYSAIDFEEFVFVPTSSDEHFESRDYVSDMLYYYYFKPNDLHRVNAWKKPRERVNLADSGGHRVQFNAQKIYPVKFILRHYMVLSCEHALRKYGHERVYSQREVNELGWHGSRAKFSPDKFRIPLREELKHLSKELSCFDRSQPQVKHLIFME